DRAHNCDDDAPNVQTGDARCAKEGEQIAAYQSADNSERDVEPETLALCVDNFASNEPGDQAEYNPADDGHVLPPFELCLETVRHLAAALRTVLRCQPSEQWMERARKCPSPTPRKVPRNPRRQLRSRRAWSRKWLIRYFRKRSFGPPACFWFARLPAIPNEGFALARGLYK